MTEALHYPFLLLNFKHESCEYQFLVYDLTQPGIEAESTVLGADLEIFAGGPLKIGYSIFANVFVRFSLSV